MKLLATMLTILALGACSDVQAPKTLAPPDVAAITPALADYTDKVLFGDVWKRPELAPRDRSIVTLTALIVGGNAAQMPPHLRRALDNGVKPSEITGLITHLAFYSGWPRAVTATAIAKDVFVERGIGPEQLKPASDVPLPIDQASEAKRQAAIAGQAAVAPALVEYTNHVLFGDLWRRADLTPRDRSLVTIAALISAGELDQLPFHLNRGMDNGLTRTEVSEVITHLAFYAGWPKAISAVPVAKAVFEGRGVS